MLNRRSLIMGAAGAAAALFASSPKAQAKVYGKYDVPSELLDLYESNRSKIGLPKSSAKSVTGGIKQSFEKGDMYYGSGAGASFVSGKIKSGYDKAGGPAKLGLPVGMEKVSSKYGARTQKFTKGRIWYSSKDGTKVVPKSKTVRLKGSKGFRDVAGEGSGIRVSGGNMKRGVVYRTSKLWVATKMDKFIVQTLGVGTMVALSPSETGSIDGIKSIRYSIKNPGAKTMPEKKAMYRQYVTRAGNRESLGKVLKLIASSDKPVVFQCKGGRDRSGWVSAVIHGLLGASSADIMDEFMKSNKYYGKIKREYLDAGLAQLKKDYGSFRKYVLACGVSERTIEDLKKKLVS